MKHQNEVFGKSYVNTNAEGRQLEPKDEDRFECKVPWNIIQNDSECKAFEEIEEAEHDPIRKPLDVILRHGRLESLEREIRGKCPTHEV